MSGPLPPHPAVIALSVELKRLERARVDVLNRMWEAQRLAIRESARADQLLVSINKLEEAIGTLVSVEPVPVVILGG